jgi:hypothetical protein
MCAHAKPLVPQSFVPGYGNNNGAYILGSAPLLLNYFARPTRVVLKFANFQTRKTRLFLWNLILFHTPFSF